MEKDKIFAVFGLGTFGLEVCKVLSAKGKKVIAFDRNRGLIEKAKNIVTQAVLLDSTDEEALRNAGIQDVDVAVVAMRTNIDSSILTTILLKNIGVPYIIARAMSDIHAQVLGQIGATEIINLEIEQGKRLADRLTSPELRDVIPISDDQVITELRIPKECVGKSLRDLDLRQRFNVNIISIKRVQTDIDKMGNPKRKELIFSPQPMDMLEINDILIVLGKTEDINKLKEGIG